MKPPSLQVSKLSKQFGEFQALSAVDLDLAPGSFHALLGENGAGKSTLVKCIMGYYAPNSGDIFIGGRQEEIPSPKVAQDLGLGMVYQHFTLVPSMSVEENLLLARSHLPNFINWKSERERLDAFLSDMPFSVDPAARVSTLSAGQKQKVEILKQLYLGTRILFLDEPTSVLTPDEADQVLGTLKKMCGNGSISILMISHKMREVTQYAERVTILRRGRLVGGGKVGEISTKEMTELMVGSKEVPIAIKRESESASVVRLSLRDLHVRNDKGADAVKGVSFDLRSGEIYGLAGVSGNGQRELVEALSGQRPSSGGAIVINGENYTARREQMHQHHFYCLPEEPLRSAAVGSMCVEENLAFRNFDRPENVRLSFFLDRRKMREFALSSINKYEIHTSGPLAPAASLSGGNLQRLVLARDLSDAIQVFVVSNPCFGLDVRAAADVRRRIVDARNAGAAVLLLSEDLDEIFELSDRIGVVLEGRIVLEASSSSATRSEVGHAMTGHHN